MKAQEVEDIKESLNQLVKTPYEKLLKEHALLHSKYVNATEINLNSNAFDNINMAMLSMKSEGNVPLSLLEKLTEEKIENLVELLKEYKFEKTANQLVEQKQDENVTVDDIKEVINLKKKIVKFKKILQSKEKPLNKLYKLGLGVGISLGLGVLTYLFYITHKKRAESSWRGRNGT